MCSAISGEAPTTFDSSDTSGNSDCITEATPTRKALATVTAWPSSWGSGGLLHARRAASSLASRHDSNRPADVRR